MMKSKITVLFALILLSVPSVLADVIIPGTKTIDYCQKISNINDYPDYTFLAYPTAMGAGSIRIISQDTCIVFYKLNQPAIYAVKTSNFNANILNETNGTAIKSYFENNSQVIPSNLQLSSYGTVPENDPLQKVVTIYNVVSLNQNNLQIEKYKTTNTYNNGSSVETVFQTQTITTTIIQTQTITNTANVDCDYYCNYISPPPSAPCANGETAISGIGTYPNCQCSSECIPTTATTVSQSYWYILPILAIVSIAAILLNRRK